MHGGLAKNELDKLDMAALDKGTANLTKHIENIKKFGLPAVVAINEFPTDTPEEIAISIAGQLIGVRAGKGVIS